MKIYNITVKVHNEITNYGYFNRETALDMLNTLSKNAPLSGEIIIKIDNAKTQG